MKAHPVTPNLVRLTRLRLVNAYLVREDDGFTLVDTTIKGQADALIAAARDAGGEIRRIADPLVGRRRAAPDAPTGRGVWIAHQTCDLVQLRSGADGTVVRMHMSA